MQPLSRIIPKPLLPLWGRPLLQRNLEMVARWGVKEAVVNCHHRAEMLMAAVSRMNVPGLRVVLSFEPQILGTGGALAGAAWLLDEEWFWVLNSDIVVRVSPRYLLEVGRRGRPVAVLLAVQGRGPLTVRVDRRGAVRSLRGDSLGDPEAATFTGLYLAHSRLLQYTSRPPQFESLVSVLERAQRQGELIRAVIPPRVFWEDAGRPESYLRAHQALARREGGLRGGGLRVVADRGRFRGAVYVDVRAKVSPAAVVEESVVLPGAEVRRGSRVVRAVVAPGAVVSGHVSGLVVAARDILGSYESGVLRRLGWDVAGTAVEIGPVRGSDRRLYRLVCGKRAVILIRYDDRTRPENALFAPYGRFLRSLGLNVPKIIWHSPRQRIVLEEYVKGEDLLDRIKRDGVTAVQDCYRRALEQLALLHGEGMRRFCRRRLPQNPPLDRRLLSQERALFDREFASRVLGLDARLRQAALTQAARVSEKLEQARQVLIHRDFQSSNLRISESGAVFLLDFQGMRAGPAVYDLASLLCDPYTKLPGWMRDRLLAYYASLADDCGLAIELDYFWWGAVQRLLQALGAFGRLSRISGMEYFAGYMCPGLELLERAARRVGLAALEDFCAAAAETIRSSA